MAVAQCEDSWFNPPYYKKKTEEERKGERGKEKGTLQILTAMLSIWEVNLEQLTLSLYSCWIFKIGKIVFILWKNGASHLEGKSHWIRFLGSSILWKITEQWF